MTCDYARRGKIVSHAEFARLWADPGLTLAQIGDRLGIGKSAVHGRARCRGLPRRRGGAKTVLRNAGLFDRMFVAGVRADEMAAHFGVHPNSIRSWARRRGLRRNKGLARISLREFTEMELAASMAADAGRRVS